MRCVRRTGTRARVLRAELLSPLTVLAVVLAAAAPSPRPSALSTLAPAVVQADAAARSAGNRRADAERLARTLLVYRRPLQVLKVRVDAAGSHAVAGIVLSGVKFHGPVDEHTFLLEVADLVNETLAAAPVEEVDVWTTVPIAVGKGEVVAGDFAEPTSRIVFSATIRRSDVAKGALPYLERGRSVFWDPSWRASLK